MRITVPSVLQTKSTSFQQAYAFTTVNAMAMHAILIMNFAFIGLLFVCFGIGQACYLPKKDQQAKIQKAEGD